MGPKSKLRSDESEMQNKISQRQGKEQPVLVVVKYVCTTTNLLDTKKVVKN